MKLTIPEIPPSLNKTLRMHWTARRRLNAAWGWLVREQIPQFYLKPIVKMRCSVILAHSRMYDRDNLYGSVKPIVDALKLWKLIYDDADEYLELTVTQTKCPRKESHTLIELEAL